ncbi:DUF4489 domain-containing protein [Anaeromicrobium sediminis]|uniref:Uncharacterized protein n=1 Tax=Anaeromicrobium sediminis TaxID=1478221 RepID=A0A267MAB0_9FIRM|nr:DUF4489 domain-containing protein [Anaeromicrobium sediminis]PAB55858.1 hypothetical protein CCE28_21515 [Anaeromicrobium sediminis]
MSCNNIYECKTKDSKPQNILLECGQGTGSKTFTSSNDDPFQLAHVTLDTASLNRPEVVIKFSSLVKMERLINGATVRLQYELFKVCKGEDPKSLGIWVFEEINVLENAFESQEESFSFIFCECQPCHECCDYFVIVTPDEINGAIATVSNGRIVALSQSSQHISKDKYKVCGEKLKGKYPKTKKVLSLCGQGNGSIIFRNGPEIGTPVEIAHIIMDITSLIKTKVLIEFSSIVKIDLNVSDIRLRFELFRVSNGEKPLSRGTWTFERTGVVEDIELEKVFDFVFCEEITCEGCWKYFVTVTPVELEASFRFADVTVDNVRITGLAQSSCDLPCYHDCKPKAPKPKGILLECGEGTGSRIFTSSNDPPFQLAQVSINTTGLCEPMVNIEFSSIVSFERLTSFFVLNGRLRYELFGVCDNESPISLGVWVIERINFSDIDKSTNIFNFTFCDCITCPGCCDYFVTVTPIEITEDVIRVTVSNGRMVALAQKS